MSVTFLSALRLPLTRSNQVLYSGKICTTLSSATQNSRVRKARGLSSSSNRTAKRDTYGRDRNDQSSYNARSTANSQRAERPASNVRKENSGPLLKAVKRTSTTTLSEMTTGKFSDLGLKPSLLEAILKELNYEKMTVVQEKSIPLGLSGKDIVVKARTGTGKTLAFLTSAFDRALRHPISRRHTAVLAISPTRELAQQIANEASVLLSRTLGAHTQVVYGGTNVKADYRNLKAKGAPFLLVATPGRLFDHLTSESGFKEALSRVSVLILDEADQLLDMGFRAEIERIIRELPTSRARQTLMFSATMPADVRSIARLVMRQDYDVVDCVGEAKNTHEHVEQSVCISPMEHQVTALREVLKNCKKAPDYKIIVFFPTARLTQFFAELFDLLGEPVLEIHSRRTQGHRTRMSERFRAESGIIMFTSNVTARGLDYPDVTSVVQVGLPSDKTQYVHRLGRTARAGKVGNGVLVLSDFEQPFMHCVKEIPIGKFPFTLPKSSEGPPPDVVAACSEISSSTKETAYQSMMGYYNSHLKLLRWSKEDLVRNVNNWVTSTAGEKDPPMLMARTVGKMGLKGVSGLRVHKGPPPNRKPIQRGRSAAKPDTRGKNSSGRRKR